MFTLTGVAVFLIIVVVVGLLIGALMGYFDSRRRRSFDDPYNTPEEDPSEKKRRNFLSSNFRSFFMKGHTDPTWHNYWFEGAGLMLLLISFLVLLAVRNDVTVTFVVVMLAAHLRFQIVEAPQRWVIELYGYPVAVWGPGLHVLYPGMTVKKRWIWNSVQTVQIHVDENRGTYIDGDGKTTFSMDGFGDLDFLDETAGIEMSLLYRIVSPYLATYAVENLIRTMIINVESETRSVLSALQLDEAVHVKEGAAKLVKSAFLRPTADGYDDWRRKYNTLPVYEKDGDRRIWIDEDHPVTPNRFLTAYDEPLSNKDEDFTLYDWGVAFGENGIAISDFKLRPETVAARAELLKSKRSVEAAAFERRVRELEGLGEKDYLKAIVDAGVEPADAPKYATAMKMMVSGTLRDKTLLLSPGDGGLDPAKLAAIFGLAQKAANEDSNGKKEGN